MNNQIIVSCRPSWRLPRCIRVTILRLGPDPSFQRFEQVPRSPYSPHHGRVTTLDRFICSRSRYCLRSRIHFLRARWGRRGMQELVTVDTTSYK